MTEPADTTQGTFLNKVYSKMDKTFINNLGVNISHEKKCH